MKLLSTLLVAMVTGCAALGSVNEEVRNLRKLEATAKSAGLTDAQVEAHGVLTIDGEVDKCTAIVVGPKAGIEGPMTTHTADCGDCDFRISKVTYSGPVLSELTQNSHFPS